MSNLNNPPIWLRCSAMGLFSWFFSYNFLITGGGCMQIHEQTIYQQIFLLCSALGFFLWVFSSGVRSLENYSRIISSFAATYLFHRLYVGYFVDNCSYILEEVYISCVFLCITFCVLWISLGVEGVETLEKFFRDQSKVSKAQKNRDLEKSVQIRSNQVQNGNN